MAETEYYEKQPGVFGCRLVDTNWRPTPHFLEDVVEFDDPNAVAAELIDRGDYNGHSLIGSFSEADVVSFALEDAHKIIDARHELLRERSELQNTQLTAIASLTVRAATRTVFVVSRSQYTTTPELRSVG
jgi:hypothetical protein